MRSVLVSCIGIFCLALILGPGVAVEDPTPAAGSKGEPTETVFEAEYDGPHWYALDLTVTNNTLHVARAYSNITDTWTTDAILIYDRDLQLRGGSFMRGQISSTTWSSLHVKVGDEEHGVSTYERSDEQGGSVVIHHIFMHIPDRIQVVLWSAGPSTSGTVSILDADTLLDRKDGPEAYAITMGDFESEAWARLVVEGRSLETTPVAQHQIPVHHRLLGVALEPSAGILTMQSGDDTRICRCYMTEHDEWLTEDADFLLSGATVNNLTIMAADVAFAGD